MPNSTCTKILATLGPASNSEEKIGELIEAGVDGFRLNFSHGTHEEHRKVYDTIRNVALTGVDIISLGALTHSVTAFDISMKWKKK